MPGYAGPSGLSTSPPGDSAWQFKAGDLTPSKCRKELRDAEERGGSAALGVVRAGGVDPRLVLGADLTEAKVRSRRVALEQEAAALGIEVIPGMFEVLNASDFAAWAEEHPALAVSPLLHGIGNVAHPFAQWSASNRLTGRWAKAPSRDGVTEAIRRFITGFSILDLRRSKVSVASARLASFLRRSAGQDCEPLVAYVYAADVLPSSLDPSASRRRNVMSFWLSTNAT